MDFFLYKETPDYDGFGASFGATDQRSDLELLDDIRNVKSEDLDMFFPEPKLDLAQFECGLFTSGEDNSVSIPQPHLLPSDTLCLKREQQKVNVVTRRKVVGNSKTQKASKSNPRPRRQKVTRSLKRAKAIQETPPEVKRAKKSHKRQRVTKEERSRIKTELEQFVHYRNQALLVRNDDSTQSGCLCPFPGCSYKCVSLELLKDHMELHKAGQKRHFRCTECKEVFYSSGCLTSHAITHSRGGTTSFCCPSEGCGKRYATAEGLRLHTRNHHQVNKTWKCMADDCNISFVRKSDLQMHIIRMHSKERPYPCPQKSCSKAFACHSELRRHLLKIHEVECPKLPKDGSLSKPKNDVFERLIREATLHRDELRKKRALEKARLQKERKALLRLQRAAAKEAKRAAKRKSSKLRSKRS